MMLPRRSPFPDVRLGPFIGKGTFSRVFRATYQEAICAVKVRTQMPSCLTSKAGSNQSSLSGPALFKHSFQCNPTFK